MFSRKKVGLRATLAALLTRPSAAVVVAAVVAPLAFAAAPATAAFPGQNGRIAFVSERDGNREIYVMNADGSGQTRLTNTTADEWGPAFSPDGSRIAFESRRDGNGEIYVMEADGSGQTRLTYNAALDGEPAFSPDDRKIAFSRGGDIYVMNADGSGQTLVANNGYEPEFSLDGSKIVFVSFRDGDAEIYVMNADGSGQMRRTNDPAWNWLFSLSPDGGKIAYTRWGGLFNPYIYVMNANGTEHILTNGAAWDSSPAFSPDGTKIAFNRGADIYIMNANGSGQTRLTNGSHPDWGPVARPLLTVSDVSGAEGGPAARVGDLLFFTFTVSLSFPSAAEVSVDVATRDDSARAGSDYVSTSERLTFAPGETRKEFFVQIIGDRLHEADERFFVELNFALGASFGDAQGVGTIVDDDATPVLTVPATIMTSTQNPNGTAVSYTVSATDQEDPSPAVSCTPPSGSTFPIGTTTVACTATDSDGNTATATFEVIVDLIETSPCPGKKWQCDPE
jgi:dipeptidyl aminopeptidase/acylaminoacyl peptidase